MRKTIFLGSIMMCAIFVLGGCGQKYMCRECEKAVRTIYYDIDGDAAYCEDCAKEYWAPFDYNEYRVKE